MWNRLEDEAFAKEHFVVTKSPLYQIMEDTYFPCVDIHEHVDMYNRLDYAIKLQHEKL